MRPLTTPELDVLRVLAEGQYTPSVVRLAADLYQRGSDARFNVGDPVGFVTWLLEALAERNLVVYRVPDYSDTDAPPGYYGLPFHIRLTQTGWEVCGYPRIQPEVGRRPDLVEVRKGDPTDWRNHTFYAKGGPIERLPWQEHRVKYPTHPHGFPLWGIPDPAGADMSSMTRPYNRVTPELEDRVVLAFERLQDYAKVAKELNISERQAKYVLRDRPRLGRDGDSLKSRVLRAIADNGPYVDTAALAADVPGSHGTHNLVHILHSLHKAQLIDFRESGGGTSPGTDYRNIHIRKDVEVARKDVTSRDIQDDLEPRKPQPVALTVGPTYPELERIKLLRVEQDAQRRKSGQYLQAAELLQESDPETAELLLAKAAETEASGLSPVESEYLAYVEDHTHAD